MVFKMMNLDSVHANSLEFSVVGFEVHSSREDLLFKLLETWGDDVRLNSMKLTKSAFHPCFPSLLHQSGLLPQSWGRHLFQGTSGFLMDPLFTFVFKLCIYLCVGEGRVDACLSSCLLTPAS